MAPGAATPDLQRGMNPAGTQTLANPAYEYSSDSGGSIPFFFIRWSMYALMPLVIAEGALFQAQMLVLHGRIVANTAVLKAMVIGLLMMGLMIRRRISNAQVLGVTLLFAGYSLLECLRMYFSLNMQFIDIIESFNSYYAILLVAILALMVPLRIPDRMLIYLLLAVFAICALIGLAQFITGSALIPTQSSDGSFQVNGTVGVTTIRPFSLFLDAGMFGILGVVVGALGTAYCLKRNKRWLGVPILLGGMVVTAISQSREDFPALLGAILSVVFISRWRTRILKQILPVVWLLLGVVVGFVAYYLSTTGGVTHSVTDTSTFVIRLQNWAYYISSFTVSDPMGIFFGYGIVENHRVSSSASIVPIDNFFLATALHIGVVGIVVVILLAWVLWAEVLRAAEETQSTLSLAVAGSFSTLLCLGMFQPTFEPVAAYYLLFAFSQSAAYRSYPPSELAESS